MPNFDIDQPDPKEIANVPITVPVTKTAGGQGYVGVPTNPDPLAAQEQAQASFNASQSLRDFNAAHPGLAGAPSAQPLPVAAPAAIPVAAPVTLEGTPTGTPGPAGTPAVPAGAPAGSPTGRTGGARPPGAAPAPEAADLQQLRTDAKDARALAGDLQTATKEGEAIQAQNATAEATERARAAAEVKGTLEKQQRDRASASAKVEQLRLEASKRPYHSFFEDKSTGQTILAGLGMLLGGVSFDPNHQNQAVGIIQSAIKQNFEQQKEEHAALWKNVEIAMQQGRDLSQSQLQEMADIRTKQALQLDAVLAQGRALAGKNQARQDSLKKQLEAGGIVAARDQAVDESVRLHQAADEAKRHNRVQEGIEYAKVGAEREKARAGLNDQGLRLADQLAQRARNGAQGKTLTTAENRLEQAQSGLEALKPGPDGKINQVTAYEALMGYVRTVTGGVPTKEQSEAVVGSLGGISDQARRRLQQLTTGGKITAEDVPIIKDALTRQVQYRASEVNNLRKPLHDSIVSHPALSQIDPQQRELIVGAAGFGPLQAPEAPQASIREGQTAGNGRYKFTGGKWIDTQAVK